MKAIITWLRELNMHRFPRFGGNNRCRSRLPAVQAIFGALFALALTSVPASAQAASDTTGAASAISPDDARRALAVLQDPSQRASAESTLKAIADAAPATTATTAPFAPTGTSTSPSPPAASAAVTPAATEHPATAPLEANGLVAQMLRQIDHWSASLGDQLIQIKLALLELPALLGQFGASFGDASTKALLVDVLVVLVAVFAAGLALEWGLRRVLVRPRQALIEHAAKVEANARAQAIHDEALRREQMAREQAMAHASSPDQRRANAAASGTRPPDDGVALVRSQRDGVDQIDAVAVGSANAAGPANDVGTDAIDADAAMEATGNTMATASRMRRAAPSEHWSRLRQLPLAIGALVLDLLPLALFFVAAALLSHWLVADEQVRGTIRAFVDAYVSTRVTMAILRLLVSPAGRGVPVLRISDAISAVLYKWLRRIVVVATFGAGLADAAQALGAGADSRLAVLKIVSLLVHVFAVILIFRVRQPVGRMIAAPAHATGPLAAARGWLAHSWAWFAAVLVMGVWIVWALGVQNGFPRLIHFIGVTAGVIVVARVLGILIIGALARTFQADGAATETDNAAASAAAVPATRRRLDRYYPLVHRLVSIVISACAVVALLQAWGLDAVGWFTHRTVGRSLLSAVLTITVAAFVAVFVWEAVNSAVERRLAYWQQQGELVRTARLRTLLPILRTCLFIAILLVVGLTALNEIGINTTPLLAGASIIGVALGFGSQKLVQDFITGIFLLMENAMQVGDWVTVAGVSGVVEYLSIRTVRLRAGDGSLHIVPFSSVSTVNNTNRGLGNAVMRVSVSYGVDVAQVTDELKQIGAALRDDPAFKEQILNDLEVWGVDAVDGSTVTLAGQMRCTDKGRWGVQRELNRRILDRFRQIGIQIADPRATVLLPSETTPPVASAAQRPISAESVAGPYPS